MGFLDMFSGHVDEVNAAPHKAQLSHELIAGAVAYEAEKAYEKHRATNGQPESHAQAKEIVAALSGGILDRLVETKGLDWVDKERVQHQVHQHFENQNAY